MESQSSLPVRLGISSCLLGAQVRHDGGHKRDSFLAGELGRHVEWVSVCPELEAGMGVPREPVRLLEAAALHEPRMVGVRTGRDWTRAMLRHARERVKALERLDLSGYVLKSKSPSCGLEQVEVYGKDGKPRKSGRGLFAAVLLEHFPLLPVEEESRLRSPAHRENFIERVFSYHRWLLFRAERFTRDRLLEFHRRHECLVLARSETALRRLAGIAGSARGRPRANVLAEYSRTFFEALRTVPAVRTHVIVLRRLAASFEPQLDSRHASELRESIKSYQKGRVPRAVPRTLILHHARRQGATHLEEQYYLSPHPKELALRYHA